MKNSECYKKNNIPELMRNLVNDLLNLFSSHVYLLKYDIQHEIKKEIKSALNQLFLVLLCIFTGFCGLIFLGFFLIVIIASMLPLWLSILLITILYFIASLILLFFALNKIKMEKHRNKLDRDGD